MIMMALIINFSETCFFRLGMTWCSLVLATLATYPLILRGNVIEEGAESYSPEPVSATVVESIYESR